VGVRLEKAALGAVPQFALRGDILLAQDAALGRVVGVTPDGLFCERVVLHLPPDRGEQAVVAIVGVAACRWLGVSAEGTLAAVQQVAAHVPEVTMIEQCSGILGGAECAGQGAGLSWQALPGEPGRI